VAEEASRLLDALGGWAGAAGAAYAAAGTAEHPPHHHGPQDHDAPQEPRGERSSQDDADGGAHGSPLRGTSRCESCGAENGVGQAVTCQLCPVCQGIALVRSVRPETVDRLADLAGALAATLRDLADQRRAGAQGSAARPGGPSRAGGASGTRVQDIRIDSDDEAGEAP
jgi:hypothetical protein